MEKKEYLVQLGFEHPNSGHQLLLSGYLVIKPVVKATKGK